MANKSQDEISGKFKESLSLEDILLAFNNPVNEEQAWAVCYQCAHYFQNLETQSLDCRLKYHELYKYGKRAVKFYKDGALFIEYSEISRGTGKGPPGRLRRKNSVTGKDIKIVTENDAIQALGLVIYQALDYGLGDNEERHLGRDLEHLLELMINPDEDDETFNADDEGIEKDAKEGSTFQEIKVLCIRHLTSQQDAGYHYKAVCRALAAEAAELLTFLDKVTIGNERLAESQLDQDLQKLDDLQRVDWARLWVQMMRELRQGVRLKKVEHIHLPPVEFELTPFEILLEDIRTRRYTLNKIAVNGDIPNKVKSDAHAMMLDFIRSRPPLQPAKDRVLKSPPERKLSAREQMLVHIRSQPKLRSVKDSHIVETSRTKLDNENEEEPPQPVKKVIKPDFNLLLDSFEDDDDDDSSGTLSPKSRRSSVASPSPEKEIPQWRRTVVRDAVTQDRPNNMLQRRNTITVCESPQVSPQNSTVDSGHDNKLKRAGHVSKANACPSDLRKRLNDKLHGRSSVSQLHCRRLHGSISEHPSENEQLPPEKSVTESVKSESRSVQRAASSVGRVSTIKSTDQSTESQRVKRTSYRLVSKAESNSSTQNIEGVVRVQRKVSDNGSSFELHRRVHRKFSDESEPKTIDSESRIHRRLTDNGESDGVDSRTRIRRRVSESGRRLVKSGDDSTSAHRRVLTGENSSVKRLEETYERIKQRLSSSRENLAKSTEKSDQEKSKSSEKDIVSSRLQSDSAANKIQRAPSQRSRAPVSNSVDGNSSRKDNETSRPHSPKIMVPRRSTSPISQVASSPMSPTHLSTTFAGLTELSSSPIKLHASPTKQVHDHACLNDSEESEVSLGRSHPSRRILVTRRSSMPTSKSCNDLETDSVTSDPMQRTQSVLDVCPDKPRPKPRPRISKRNSVSEIKKTGSNEQSPEVPNADEKPKEETNTLPPKPVPRPRKKIVQRSHSQLSSVRHSLDLSQLSAINKEEENGLDSSGSEDPSQSTRFRSKTPGPSMHEESESPRLSELSVDELLNVSENTECVQTTNGSSAPPSQDSSSSDSKWNHPIECLSLTLEEVIHIRNVLTKAELETLITQPELYHSVSKGKVCFTCKKVELSIMDWWRNKCKICKRLVCNNCLRKMNIPKDQFNSIPVHTLCPIPLGQEARDILKVYESTGSVPHSPKSQRKLLQEVENKSPKKRGLQRSQTFNTGSNLATPLPNKNLLKGPQMNVCCECKGMIMDIIRTSRTSIAIVNKGQAVKSPENNQEERHSLSLSASSLSQSVRNLFTSK